MIYPYEQISICRNRGINTLLLDFLMQSNTQPHIHLYLQTNTEKIRNSVKLHGTKTKTALSHLTAIRVTIATLWQYFKFDTVAAMQSVWKI